MKIAIALSVLTCVSYSTGVTFGAEPALSTLPETVQKIDLLPPSAENPRNSEGSFVTLKNGDILFIYTHFTGGAGDASTAHLASRVSKDGGRTWSDKDVIVAENEAGQNIMSVSLLRLADGRIALFYLQKQSESDCRPVIRYSEDEATTWSEPHAWIPDEDIGYYVMNNDRALQLDSGRLICPFARHNWKGKAFNPSGAIVCYVSDDAGKTWTRGEEVPIAPADQNVIQQEPGLVVNNAGELWLFTRTNGGAQYGAQSKDGGLHWSTMQKLPLPSPVSPATLERIPGSDRILAVWNDHANVPAEIANKRTPLVVALGTSPNQEWERQFVLEDNPHGWFCYTAMHFTEDAVLLGYCAGDRRENNGLAFTRVTRIPLNALLGLK